METRQRSCCGAVLVHGPRRPVLDLFPVPSQAASGTVHMVAASVLLDIMLASLARTFLRHALHSVLGAPR